MDTRSYLTPWKEGQPTMQWPLVLHAIRQESLPDLTDLKAERDPLTPALLREATVLPPELRTPPHLWELQTERDPRTLALLQEAYPQATAEWLHRDLLRSPRPGTKRTPSSSSECPPPDVKREAAIRRAIDRNRIWATTDAPISTDATIEHRLILDVLYARRKRASWQGQLAFERWPQEAQDLIAAALPSRRRRLQDYADRRDLIRRKRRTWKLAEQIVSLDTLLDGFPTEGGELAHT